MAIILGDESFWEYLLSEEPDAKEKGRVIFHETKESGTERIVVCAPIKIGKTDYYMGVMLQRDSRYQRLYLHNVVSVEIKEEATSLSKDDLVTTGALESDNRLFITSIIQKALDVKRNKQQIQASVFPENPNVEQFARENVSGYDRTNIYEIFRDYKLNSIEEATLSLSNRFSRPNLAKNAASEIIVSDLYSLVKTYDRNFHPNPVSPLMLNEDGTPKIYTQFAVSFPK